MNNRSNKIKMLIITSVYIIGLVFLEKFFELICDSLFKSFLWWSSAAFLITGLILFCMYINKKFKVGNKKYSVILLIVFVAIGEILLIIDSILFIENIFVTISLLLSVTFIYFSIMLFQYFLSQINCDDKNIDEQIEDSENSNIENLK